MFLPSAAFAQAQDTVIYYHTDAIGSVRMITDENGQVVARYDYLSFGEPCGAACGPAGPPDARQFAGKEKDPETGFDYFGARYYASGTGRFTTVDPALDLQTALVDPQRWNRYTYARNNPLRYTDPDGRELRLAAGLSRSDRNYLINALTEVARYPSGRELLVAVMNDPRLGRAEEFAQQTRQQRQDIPRRDLDELKRLMIEALGP